MENVPSFEKIFRQIKINFWVIGMPFGNINANSRFFLTFCALSVVVSEEVAFFVTTMSSENFLELTQLAPCAAMGILSLLKIFWIYTKKEKVFQLTLALKKLYNDICDDPNQIDSVKREIILLEKLISYYFILNAILISIYNFSSLPLMAYHYFLTHEVKFYLPYSVLLPVSVDVWYNWLIVYLHLITCGFICALFFTTVDALYFILTSQVCVNFTVLCKKLENFTRDDDNSLPAIIKKHQYILKLSNDLEDIFIGPNFFNVLVGSLLICALGFNLTTGDWAQIPGFILFLSSVLLQILMMSVFGENLIRESGRIGDAVFLCNWYEFDRKTMKTILILRERAQRPQKLTAYRFSTISYASFTKIISTSWSYFTILRTVYRPTENN